MKQLLLTVFVLGLASLAHAATAEVMCRSGETNAIVENPDFVFLLSSTDMDDMGSAYGNLHAGDLNDSFVDGEITYKRNSTGACVLSYNVQTSLRHTLQFDLPITGATPDHFFPAKINFDGRQQAQVACSFTKTPKPATCEEFEAEQAAIRTTAGVNPIYGFEIEKCGAIVDRAYGHDWKQRDYCDKRALCDVKLPSGGTISAFANLFCDCFTMRSDTTKCAKDNSVRNLEAFAGLNAADRSRPKTRIALPPNLRDSAK